MPEIEHLTSSFEINVDTNVIVLKTLEFHYIIHYFITFSFVLL